MAEQDSVETKLSDIASRLQKLEQAKPPEPPAPPPRTEEIVWFAEPKEIYNHSITVTETTWSDSTSNRYIPVEAKRAVVFIYCDGTSDAIGLNAVYARGGGVEGIILACVEEGSTSAPGGCNQLEVPVSEGRFEVKATIGSGRSSGSFDFVILVKGYVK